MRANKNCFVSAAQVGGSASVTPNEDGFLHLTWSLWTAQRSQKKLNQTTKASCSPCLLYSTDGYAS